MKIIILLAALTITVASEYYKTGDENFDVNALFANIPRLQIFLDCYKDAGPCSELAYSYKKHIPEAVKQACRRCSPGQKYRFRVFLERLKRVLPEEYTEFKRKFDPENKYFDALEKAISQY